jgi:hypothetical protein
MRTIGPWAIESDLRDLNLERFFLETLRRLPDKPRALILKRLNHVTDVFWEQNLPDAHAVAALQGIQYALWLDPRLLSAFDHDETKRAIITRELAHVFLGHTGLSTHADQETKETLKGWKVYPHPQEVDRAGFREKGR